MRGRAVDRSLLRVGRCRQLRGTTRNFQPQCELRCEPRWCLVRASPGQTASTSFPGDVLSLRLVSSPQSYCEGNKTCTQSEPIIQPHRMHYRSTLACPAGRLPRVVIQNRLSCSPKSLNLLAAFTCARTSSCRNPMAHIYNCFVSTTDSSILS
jgi:hypothetical protein